MSLNVQNLWKQFGTKQILNGVDFEVKPHDIHAIVGVSGSGKSTILRIIAGLESADSGDVKWNHRSLIHIPAHKRRVTMLSQTALLFPHLTVGENVTLVTRERSRKQAEHWLRVVQLGDRYDAEIHELSGGEQQRVSLARALAAEPELLLLDEPFTNLDPKLKLDLQRFIRDLVKELNLTAVLVTHDREEAMLMADQVTLIDEGKVTRTGTVAELYDTAPGFGDFVMLDGKLRPLSEVEISETIGEPVQLMKKIYRFGQCFGEYHFQDGKSVMLPTHEWFVIGMTYRIKRKEEYHA
ncbi:ABC transporter ATP-binding protein [Exiguobacterium profundum]|uniref:ABC transporter ATP-binding protein n=1 Tax=Exiguobacterium profundum TaxID=307643 RepID=A0ABY8B7K3_9BACL|nr:MULTISPECIES: ABC transporter ATP-binding protein [Exiguobacterium]WED56509.1 ABC transporter ATP-binding protein [Exiguobacterium profundum]